MNCQDVVAFVIEPGIPSEGVREHLRTCDACRAHVAECRRVASLLADLPVEPGTDIASRVMGRIGYGNGRPTRDKIMEQLDQVRLELNSVIRQAGNSSCAEPSAQDPSIEQIVSHLASVEADEAAKAERSLLSDSVPDVARAPSHNNGGTASRPAADTGHTHMFNATAASSAEDFRRVRDGTLRLLSALDQRMLDHSTAELLRGIYRHEADHVAQITDSLWRTRRKSELAKTDLGDGH